MKNLFKFLGVFTIGILIFLTLHLVNNIGTDKLNVEVNARTAEDIPDNWEVCKDISDNIASLLFYDDNTKKHTFSIYINKKGPCFGYFNKASGSLGSIMDDILEFHLQGYNERIFMSMNKKQASKVTINNGNTIETIEVNSTKPFTIVVPNDDCTVTIYDVNDNVLESIIKQLY